MTNNATMIVLVALLVLGGLAVYGRRVQRRGARDARLLEGAPEEASATADAAAEGQDAIDTAGEAETP